jgi:DNA-binding CsgD family transcriptional regulator
MNQFTNDVLLRELYSTEHHLEKWPPLLDQIYPICNADYAGLAVIEHSPTAGDSRSHTFSACSSNIDDVAEAEYLEKYSHYESKHIELTSNAPIGKIVLDPDFEDYDTIIQRPDVDYAIKNLNIFHRVGIRLNDEKTYSDFLAIQLRPDRLTNITESEIAPLKPYLTHIAQAIAMGRVYDSIRQKYHALLSMLDRVNVGMVLLRHDGVVVLANSYAREIIGDSSRIKIGVDGIFKVMDTKTNDYFKSRLQMIQSQAERDAKYIIRLGDDLERDDLVVELSPLLDSESDIGSNFVGTMAIIVDPNRPFLANHESVSSLYALTKAETHVAHLIADGCSYNDAAERRGVSRETIKSQASNLMQKMNVKTRAGVIRKFITLGIPFND